MTMALEIDQLNNQNSPLPKQPINVISFLTDLHHHPSPPVPPATPNAPKKDQLWTGSVDVSHM